MIRANRNVAYDMPTNIRCRASTPALVSLLFSSLLFACDSDTPERVDPQTFCENEDYDERLVVVEGTIQLPSEFISLPGVAKLQLLVPGRGVTVSIWEGEGPNSVAPLPAQFDDSDLRVHTADGTDVGSGSRVRIVGEADVTSFSCELLVYSNNDDHSVDALPESAGPGG